MRLDRLSRIENYIMQQEHVSLENLAEKFQLSVNTARRDVIELEKRGCILRIRGGAMAKGPIRSPEEIDTRHQKNADAKRVIGSLAAKLVQPGQTIFIDAGSTTRNIVPHLNKTPDITIITSSVNVLVEATRLPGITLIVLGGEYSATSDSFHSYTSISDMENFNFDLAFLGTTGLSIDGGLTTATFMEAAIKSTAMRRAKETVVVADQSKFGIRSTSKFANLSEASTIVSDHAPSKEITAYCQNGGIQLITAEADSML
jgi:DeoR family myo-inositol catabolism operon transcriptional repressor